MADQSVRITHLPDNSAVRVAFDLFDRVRGYLPQKSGTEAIQAELALFTECRHAAFAQTVDLSRV